MPRITEELVRSRAEHNNCEISSLEELSLHQQDIEKIEHLDKWCRDIKILYLQSNLIPKIENVGRMKQLQYLNLALNNITKIENTEGCEALEKLDLTINFIGDLLSVESLRQNSLLKQLYLTGNPCTDYEGYREFVVAVLPQLNWLDGKEITRSERILALQKVDVLRGKIIDQQEQYEKQRVQNLMKEQAKEQKTRAKKPGFDRRWYTDSNAHLSRKETSDENEQPEQSEDMDFDEPVPFTPETRTAAHKYIAEKRKPTAKEPNKNAPMRVRNLERDGRMLNVNEGKYQFSLVEDDKLNQYVLEVACPKFMDTSLMDCDVQPKYVRVTIKGKVLQLVLQEEVYPDKSTAKRSQTSGCLVITMPMVRDVLRPSKSTSQKETRHDHMIVKKQPPRPCSNESLEVENKQGTVLDIVNPKSETTFGQSTTKQDKKNLTINQNEQNSFIDDPDVPPLL